MSTAAQRRSQAGEVVAVERLLQPVDAEPFHFARRLHRPLVRPDRAFFRLRRAGLLRLIRIGQDDEVVAHRAAHTLDLRDVLLDRPIVQAQFHRPPPGVARSQCILAALLAGTGLDATGIGGHAIVICAPEPEQGLADRLADDVPERDFHTPRAARVAKEARMLFEGEGVLANEHRLEDLRHLRQVLRRCRAPADDALIGRHFHKTGPEARPCPAWRPCRLERLRRTAGFAAGSLRCR